VIYTHSECISLKKRDISKLVGSGVDYDDVGWWTELNRMCTGGEIIIIIKLKMEAISESTKYTLVTDVNMI